MLLQLVEMRFQGFLVIALHFNEKHTWLPTLGRARSKLLRQGFRFGVGSGDVLLHRSIACCVVMTERDLSAGKAVFAMFFTELSKRG
jgi:hypothetical protein